MKTLKQWEKSGLDLVKTYTIILEKLFVRIIVQRT